MCFLPFDVGHVVVSVCELAVRAWMVHVVSARETVHEVFKSFDHVDVRGILSTSSVSSASASSTSSLVIVAASALVLGLLLSRGLVHIWALSKLHVILPSSSSASSSLLTFVGRVGLLVGGLASILLLRCRYVDGGGHLIVLLRCVVGYLWCVICCIRWWSPHLAVDL